MVAQQQSNSTVAVTSIKVAGLFLALSAFWGVVLWWYDRKAQERTLNLIHDMWSISPARYGLEVEVDGHA